MIHRPFLVKRTLKPGVTFTPSGKQVKIDVLRVRKEFAAGTLSEEHRQIFEAMLPGLLAQWAKEAEKKEAAP